MNRSAIDLERAISLCDPSIPDHLVVSPKVAADLLGCSSVTLQRWRTQGTGPQFTKHQHCVFYQVEHLRSWWASRCATSTAEARVKLHKYERR